MRHGPESDVCRIAHRCVSSFDRLGRCNDDAVGSPDLLDWKPKVFRSLFGKGWIADAALGLTVYCQLFFFIVSPYHPYDFDLIILI